MMESKEEKRGPVPLALDGPFEQWVRSLTHEQLASCVAYTFASMKEERLLRTMIEKRYRPPAPVHPRAMGFRPIASELGAEMEHPHRLMQEQMFQFVSPLARQDLPAFLMKEVKIDDEVEVIARQNRLPWGTVCAEGTTQRQRDADAWIVRKSCLVNRTKGHGADKKSDSSPTLVLHIPQYESTVSILDKLVVASRGHLFERATSEWFHPDEEWFSLSKFLASRYHTALRRSFERGFTIAEKPRYSDTLLQRAVVESVRATLKSQLELLAATAHCSLPRFRNTLLWKVINVSKTKSMCPRHGIQYESLTSLSLEDLGTEVEEWKLLVEPAFLEALANLARDEILMTEDSNLLKKPTIGGKRRNRRRKKKLKNRTSQTTSESMPSVVEEREEEEGGSTENRSSSFDFPTEAQSERERSQNIITVLAVFEECVLDSVFRKVGLGETTTTNNDQHQNHIRLKNGKPVFSSGVDAKPKIREAVTFKMPKRKKPTSDHQQSTVFQRSFAPIGNNDSYHNKKYEPLVGSTIVSSGGPSEELPSEWPDLPAIETSDSSEAISGYTWNSGTNPFASVHAYPSLPVDIFQPPARVPSEVGLSDPGQKDEDWPFISKYSDRDRSILAEFFLEQEKKSSDDEDLMAASTAVSIASSTYKDGTAVTEDGLEDDAEDEEKSTDEAGQVLTVDDVHALVEGSYNSSNQVSLGSRHSSTNDLESRQSEVVAQVSTSGLDLEIGENGVRSSDPDAKQRRQTQSPITDAICRSPSPQAPATPPPTLSPILISLSDLQKLKKTPSLTPESAPKAGSSSTLAVGSRPGSLPSSPIQSQERGLQQSWSREDLRLVPFRDDLSFRQTRTQRLLEPVPGSYRTAAMKSLAKPIKSSKTASLSFLDAIRRRPGSQIDSCARSETAVDGLAHDQAWQSDARRMMVQSVADERSTARDETTTITSAMSHNQDQDTDEVINLREERNSFRDMCLTLGAEVSVLRAQLAAQQAVNSIPQQMDYAVDAYHSPTPVYLPAFSDPHGMPPFFHGMQLRGKRLGPMSDAGEIYRPGDHESQASEDDVHDVNVLKSRPEYVRQVSSSHTIAASDSSIELPGAQQLQTGGSLPQGFGSSGFSPIGVDLSAQSHSLQSRLTKDIIRFINSNSTQLRKQEPKRLMAVERFTRFVNTLWPRAQVKMYGSHVSGLCLPSSDVDFVVCLPAVHRKDPAVAAGELEGRNAINETSQKLMARQLKGESWIDPRSIKLIDRTVVPVIKVTTKDTRARIIQLDISFESPEHHGVRANELVAEIMSELPMIRPLVLVLKQFLIDRALLTAYTGGLSSYCLFLMVARYLQDQPSTAGDIGSLLMGFLDFYGNHFDCRAMGISVRRRMYFGRPWNAANPSQAATLLPAANAPSPMAATNPSNSSLDFRRNSLGTAADTMSISSTGGGGRGPLRPPRFPLSTPRAAATPQHPIVGNIPHQHHQNRPFTFDPLYVEDPLRPNNNVGRNAFRIFQVQRAFSDAHRALVAALEWDIHTTGEDGADDNYPLLKCLLQSEDVVYSL